MNDKTKFDIVRKYINSDKGEVQKTSPNTINGITLKGKTAPQDNPSLLNASEITNQNNFFMNKKLYDSYTKYGVYPGSQSTEEDLNRARAENQKWIEQLGRSIGQAVYTEAIIGSLRAFGDIYDGITHLSDSLNGTNDFTSAYSQLFEREQENSKEKLAIYRKDPNASWAIGDFGWWADNAVSIASTLSLLIPSKAVTGSVSFLGKLGKYATTLNKLGDEEKTVGKVLKGIAKSDHIWDSPLKGVLGKERYLKFAAGTDIVGNALVSRIGENYIEARDAYNTVYDNTLDELNNFDDKQRKEFLKNNPQFNGKSNEDIAKSIAGESASKTYRDDFALLLMDVAQFKGIADMGKYLPNRAANVATRTANKKAILKSNVADAIEASTPKGLSKIFSAERKAALKDAFKATNLWNSLEALEVSEGIEEMYQGIKSQSAEEVAKMYFDPNYTTKDIVSYLSDPQIWEQGFWGMLGGVAFQGIGKGLNKAAAKFYTKANKNLSDKQVEDILLGENKKRIQEINGRKDTVDKYVGLLETINADKNPFSKVGDDFKAITDLEEKDILLDAVYDDFAQELTINAINNGNYDLLREWISNANVNQYIKEELKAKNKSIDINEDIERKLLSSMDEIEKIYSKNYTDILSNADVENPYAAQLAAAHLTRLERQKDAIDRSTDRQLAELSLQRDYRASDNEGYTLNDIDNQIINNIIGELADLKSRETGASLRANAKSEDKDRNGNSLLLSKSGYEATIREINQKRKDLVDYLMQNTAFGENARAKELYNATNYNESKLGNKYAKILDIFEDEYSNNTFNLNELDYNEETKNLIRNIAANKLQSFIIENEKVKSKSELNQLYEDFESQLYRFAGTRFNDAYETALNYIKKSNDYDKAVDDLMSGNNLDKKTSRAMDILKVGYANRRELNNDFAKDINRIKNKDIEDSKDIEKAENNGEPAIVDTPIPEESKRKESEKKSANEAVAPTDKQTNDLNDRVVDVSDVKEQKEEETLQNPSPDELYALERDAIAYRQQQTEIQYTITTANINTAALAAFDVVKEHPELFNLILTSEFNDSTYKNILNLIAAKLVMTYSFDQDLAEVIAERGFKTLLNQKSIKAFPKSTREALDTISSFILLLEGINFRANLAAGLDYEKGIDYSKISIISAKDEQAFYEKMFVELINKYNELTHSVYVGEDGKTYVNLYDISQFILQLVSSGDLNYESAILFFNKLKQFALNNKNTNIRFEGLSYLKKNSEDIINEIYNRLTTYEPIANVMHFDSPKTIERSKTGENQKLNIDKIRELTGFNKQLHIEYRYKKGTKKPISISLYYEDNDGIHQEVGYIGLVNKSENNDRYFRALGSGMLFDVSFDGTEYHMEENIDNLFKHIFDGSKPDANEDDRFLYNYLRRIFARNNPTEFSKTNENYKIPKEDIDRFINHPLIKKLIETKKLGIPKVDSVTGKIDYLTIDEYDNLKYEEKQPKLNSFTDALSNIVFYELKSYLPKSSIREDLNPKSSIRENLNFDLLTESYNNFVQNVFNNYKSTFAIQTELDKVQDKKIKNLAIDYVSDNAAQLNYSETGKEKGISEILEKKSRIKHPYVYVQNNVLYDEYGQSYTAPPWMVDGMSGILMYTSAKSPFIATFTKENAIHDKNKDLEKALIDFFKEKIETYLKSYNPEDYDNLYNTFNSLIGRQRLFTGFEISKLPSADAFAITVKDNITGKRRNVMTFFKYPANVKYNTTTKRYESTNGIQIPKDEIAKYYSPGINLNVGLDKSNVNSENYSEKLDKAIKTLFTGSSTRATLNGKTVIIKRYEGLKFNSDATIAKTFKGIKEGTIPKDAKINDYLSRKNNKLVVKIGKFEQTYENYADFLISNDAMQTTHSGRTERSMRVYHNAPTSIYVDISKIRPPVKETGLQELISKGITRYVKDNSENGELTLSAKEVLISCGFAISEAEDIIANSKTDGTGFIPDSIIIDTVTDTDDYGRYYHKNSKNKNAGKIVIYKEGIKLIQNRPQEARRLIIHEQIHKLIDNKPSFFTGEIGKQRIAAINDTWLQFYNYTRGLEKDESLRLFADTFANEWKNADDKTKANEFLAEVFSKKNLMEALANIEYKPNYIITNTEKKSLFQKLLELISKLFDLNISNENSILGTLYKTLGDNKNITIIKNTETGKVVSDIVNASKTEGDTAKNDDVRDEEIETEDAEEDYGDEDEEDINTDDLDIDASRISDIDYVDSFEKDGTNNPFGLQSIPDMESYLLQFPINERATIRAELASGRIKYYCR